MPIEKKTSSSSSSIAISRGCPFRICSIYSSLEWMICGPKVDDNDGGAQKHLWNVSLQMKQQCMSTWFISPPLQANNQHTLIRRYAKVMSFSRRKEKWENHMDWERHDKRKNEITGISFGRRERGALEWTESRNTRMYTVSTSSLFYCVQLPMPDSNHSDSSAATKTGRSKERWCNS